jgi:hypothetical protein
MLNLEDMMTVSGRREDEVKSRILDFSDEAGETNLSRRNLKKNFDLIFSEEDTPQKRSNTRLSSSHEEVRGPEDPLERHQVGTDQLGGHKFQPRNRGQIHKRFQEAQNRVIQGLTPSIKIKSLFLS